MTYLDSQNESYERNNKLIAATLSLFKGVLKLPSLLTPMKLYNDINIAHGFFITDEAYENCPQIADAANLMIVEKLYGYNILELNRGFYKSFGNVKNSTPEELVAKQITHYFTTYGLESLGIRDKEAVYIPPDVLELPENSEPVKITIIKLLSLDEVKERTLKIIMSGMALKNETLEHITTIIKELKLKSEIKIDDVPNKELRIKLCELLNKMPLEPVEFLRYMIYKKIKDLPLISNPMLLIKSHEVILAIKCSDEKVSSHFQEYIAYDSGLNRLATIFHRYKELWLAFKKESKYMAYVINKIRKLANIYHKPLTPKILDTVTSNKNIDIEAFKRELSKVTIFKKISLANSILFRRAAPESIAYFIRNGKAYTTKYDKIFDYNPEVFDILMSSIIDAVKPQVESKTIYIPGNFNYAMPTSEKLFWNSIPYNSSYELPSKNVVIAVHWTNVKDKFHNEHRVDLDLHYQSDKYDAGWNNYMEKDNLVNMQEDKIIFSGDMTDAPAEYGGATEAFFIGQSVIDDMAVINLNNYTSNEMPVPFKFVIDEVKSDRVNQKYLINSHTMSFCIPNEIVGTEQFLGFLNSDAEGNKKFYFTSASLGSRIVSRYDENTDNMVKALRTSFESCLKLKNVLKSAGAVFEKAEESEWDINLDPQTVTKDTIMNLLIKTNSD